MINNDDLGGLSGPEDDARRAFDRLAPYMKEFLNSHLGQQGVDATSREDIITMVFVRLWEGRIRFTFENSWAFFGFLRKSANWCLKDHFRSLGKELNHVELDEDFPAEDLPYLHAIADAAFIHGRIMEAADELWLGCKPGQHRERLAAQLFYLHGLPWEEVAAITQAERSDLDEWLADSGIAVATAYSHLYLGNDSLTAELIPCAQDELDLIAQQSKLEVTPPPLNWTWPEIRVLMLRFRNAMFADQILRLKSCPFKRDEYDDIVSRALAKFPFSARARFLFRKFGSLRLTISSSQIWRRLCFQYHTSDELTQSMILERIKPAADEFNAPINAGMINAWLGAGRLYGQIAKHLKEERP